MAPSRTSKRSGAPISSIRPRTLGNDDKLIDAKRFLQKKARHPLDRAEQEAVSFTAMNPTTSDSSAVDTCGALCDYVDILLLGTPLLCAVVGAAVVWAWHVQRAGSASRGWTGGSVSMTSLWLLPLIGGYAMPICGFIGLFLLTLFNASFRTLLMLDASSVPPILLWTFCTLIGPAVPLLVAFGFRSSPGVYSCPSIISSPSAARVSTSP